MLLDLHNEESLVAACRAGDAAAWQALFDRFHQRLCNTIVGKLGSGGRSRDLAEEVIANLWLRLSSRTEKLLGAFNPQRGPLVAYLHLLARHELWCYLRGQSRRPRLCSLFVELPDARQVPGNDAELDEFLASLPARGRTFVQTKILDALEPMRPLSASERKLKKRVETRLRSFLGIEQRRTVMPASIVWRLPLPLGRRLLPPSTSRPVLSSA